jgi:hypothetical protein
VLRGQKDLDILLALPLQAVCDLKQAIQHS